MCSVGVYPPRNGYNFPIAIFGQVYPSNSKILSGRPGNMAFWDDTDLVQDQSELQEGEKALQR